MVKSRDKLIGKKVVIVGGTSGIGFGAAQAFLDAGATVTVISSSEERVQNAIKRLNSPQASGHAADVRDEASFVEVLKRLAPMDHLVFSSVDISIIGAKFEDLDIDHAKHMSEVKFWGAVMIGKAVKRFDLVNPSGSLILTSGVAAYKPGKDSGTGGALNAAVLTLSKGLAADLAEKKIRVNAVVPGFVKTEMWGRMGKSEEEQQVQFETIGAKLPVGFVATPDDIAEAFLYLAKAYYATGTSVVVDGGALL